MCPQTFGYNSHWPISACECSLYILILFCHLNLLTFHFSKYFQVSTLIDPVHFTICNQSPKHRKGKHPTCFRIVLRRQHQTASNTADRHKFLSSVSVLRDVSSCVLYSNVQGMWVLTTLPV